MNVRDNLVYEFGPFLLEPHVRRLSRQGEPVSLSAPEFELLLLLVRNPGRVVEKSEIIAAVWPDVEVEDNNLTVRMSALRRALGESKGNHPYIQTIPGRGYCLTAEVKELFAETVETEQPMPSGSDVVASRSGDSFPRNRARRKWRVALYVFVAVGLLASLLYVVLRLRKPSELEAPAQSMKMRRVTQTGRVQWATLSPDGQHIAYAEQDGELSSLWLQRIGTTNPLQLLPPAKLLYNNPSFSRDGNTLYYSKCETGCRLHRIPVLGGVETALGLRADSRVAFSPDGKKMAYVRSEVVPETGNTVVRLFVTNVDGTGEEALNWKGDGRTYQGGTPAWSPDGNVIALSIMIDEGNRTYMKVIGLGVADRTESTLINSWNYIKDVFWLPDVSGFIINGREEASTPEPRMQIWRVPLTGGEPRRITNDLSNYVSISLSVDGKTLTALQWQDTSSLWIAPAENPSAATQVTVGTLDRRDGNLGLSTAPDGRLIYVSDHSGKRDLWSINADGTGLRQLTDGPHKDHYPAVSPDGRYIVFESGRDSTYNIWRVDADGRNPTRLTRGTYDSEPTFSPDGESVVYVTRDGIVPKLRRVPIGGGDPVALTDEFSQHPAFSPDGKTIVYYRMNQKQRDQRHLVFIPAQGGAAIKTVPVPNNFGSIMRWAPSGDSLSYRDNTATSIWKLPLDGTAPSLLVKLRKQRFVTFCYSQDGRQLAYSSGTQMRDVVMITRFN